LVTACRGQNSYSLGASSPSLMVGFDIIAKANKGILGGVVGRIAFDFFFRWGEEASSLSDSGSTGSRLKFPSAVEEVSIIVSISVDIDAST